MLRRNNKPTPKGSAYLLSLVWLFGALLGNLLVDLAHIEAFRTHSAVTGTLWINFYYVLTFLGGFLWLVWIISLGTAIADMGTRRATSCEFNSSSQVTMPGTGFPYEHIREGGLVAVWNHLLAFVVTIVTAIYVFRN